MWLQMLFSSRIEIEAKTSKKILTFKISYGEHDFPNLKVVLLTISVSRASCTRSFSKLKLILTYQESYLSFLSVEREKISTLVILLIKFVHGNYFVSPYDNLYLLVLKMHVSKIFLYKNVKLLICIFWTNSSFLYWAYVRTRVAKLPLWGSI